MNIISIFNIIRDIPYEIPIKINDDDKCCNWKHILFKLILEKLWYKVRFRVCSFYWDSLNLPKELININHKNYSTHVYLEVLINNKWIDVDLTWDSWLKDIFEINNWDWKNNTKITVEIVEKFSLSKSKMIMSTDDSEEILKDLKINWNFYNSLNNYLDKIRNKYS